MNIKQMLLDVMSYRRSHDSLGMDEFRNEYLFPLLKNLKIKYSVDKVGNIKMDNNSNVLFVGHLDTCHYKKDKKTRQLVAIEGDIMKLPDSADKYQVLGADCATGVVGTIIAVLNGFNGVLTIGEERGCIGAIHLAQSDSEWLSTHDFCIAIDRFGTDEIIYKQMTGMCSSVKFSKHLAEELGMNHYASANGVITDNGEWNHLIPECVNISAGYLNHHSIKESLDYVYCIKLIEKLIKIDYSSIGVHRDPSDTFDIDDENDPFGYFNNEMYSTYEKHTDTGVFNSEEEALKFIQDKNNHEALAYWLYTQYASKTVIEADYKKAYEY